MLRSNEKVEIQFILEHTSMEELVKALIERKVTALYPSHEHQQPTKELSRLMSDL
jgi:hypothetical protein